MPNRKRRFRPHTQTEPVPHLRLNEKRAASWGMGDDPSVYGGFAMMGIRGACARRL
jgi:hypothetical protein